MIGRDGLRVRRIPPQSRSLFVPRRVQDPIAPRGYSLCFITIDSALERLVRRFERDLAFVETVKRSTGGLFSNELVVSEERGWVGVDLVNNDVR